MASKLITDLKSVPNIIGQLGLDIAAAQKALNLDYLSAVERLAVVIRALLADAGVKEDERAEFLRALLVQLVPARYQFTETTLTVRLDLAQATRGSLEAGLGVGTGAVAFNAALAIAYAQDYRAAAECRTVLHAHVLDPNVTTALLERAKELADKPLEAKEVPAIDQEVMKKASDVFEKLFGAKPAKPAIKD